MKKILEVVKELDLSIERENNRRKKEGVVLLSRAGIDILGQMSLFLAAEIRTHLHLFATYDLDALVKGDYWIKEKFQALLKKEGLELDPLSHEIWIPLGSTFKLLFSSNRITCRSLDPLYALLSKAIKAKEKNRILVAEALVFYGNKLAKLIKKFDGDLDYFNIKGTKKK